MNTPWDWDEQRADTEATVQMLMSEKGVSEGALITLDVQTTAGPQSGPMAKALYLAALEAAGYVYELSSDGSVETIEVTVEGVAFTTPAIWAAERAVSEIALANGWVPEGWGFWEP